MNEFPKLDGVYCDGLGCGWSMKEHRCFCDAWLISREEFQKQFNIPWKDSWEGDQPIECKVWEAAWRFSWERYIETPGEIADAKHRSEADERYKKSEEARKARIAEIDKRKGNG